ncbi:hypothetical protein Q31b_57620 [Novipirellula aureliae]|uniref:Uncharacterized protein n=1 Tax=Novipirellula aureliae TaxID=2527966 RepID=A0A5C6DBA5_9BACT|nr:hypothetical protein [Novipirellula aureliae]TWU33445.1 hypothetical protein Q31b_57620 [Novipirellula aureliae]
MKMTHDQIVFRFLLESVVGACPDAKVYIAGSVNDDAVWSEVAAYLAETLDCITLSDGEPFLDELLGSIKQDSVSHCVIIPPFAPWKSLSDSLRHQHHRLNLEQIVLQEAANGLPAGGMLTCCLPASFLSMESARKYRDRLTEMHAPSLVVSLEERRGGITSRVHEAFRFALLTITAHKGAPQPLKFFKPPHVSTDEQLERVKADFLRLQQIQGGSTEMGYVVRDGIAGGSPLLHKLYDPKFLHDQKSMEAIGELKRMDELFDFLPILHPLVDKKHLFSERAAGLAAVIEGRQITRDGDVKHDEIRHWTDKTEGRLLQAGDICLRKIGNFERGDLVLCQIWEKDLPAVAAESVIALRPKETLDSAGCEMLYSLMRSERFADFLAARCGGSMHIHRSWFGEMQLPVPDEALRLAVRDINAAIGHFEHWKQQAIRSRNVLFELSSPKEMRNEMLAAGRVSRLRSAAASAIDDISHRIRSLYPHPVAIRWRAAEVSRHDLEGYVELLEAAEVLTFYLACMAIVQADVVDGMKVSWVGQISKRLAKGGEKSVGTSMGDWLAIIREVTESKQWKKRIDEAPFPEALTFIKDDPEANEALQRVSDARNDQAHGRGPKGAAIGEKFDEVYPDVEYLFSATEFLSDYPLRVIEQTNRDSMRKITRYTYRDLMGDHPLTPLQTEESEDSELEAGSLYFVGRSGTLHRIRPYITRRECPECGCLSLMYLDRFNANTNECILKGLDHAHTATDANITNDFRYVGFLPVVES